MCMGLLVIFFHQPHERAICHLLDRSDQRVARHHSGRDVRERAQRLGAVHLLARHHELDGAHVPPVLRGLDRVEHLLHHPRLVPLRDGVRARATQLAGHAQRRGRPLLDPARVPVVELGVRGAPRLRAHRAPRAGERDGADDDGDDRLVQRRREPEPVARHGRRRHPEREHAHRPEGRAREGRARAGHVRDRVRRELEGDARGGQEDHAAGRHQVDHHELRVRGERDGAAAPPERGHVHGRDGAPRVRGPRHGAMPERERVHGLPRGQGEQPGGEPRVRRLEHLDRPRGLQGEGAHGKVGRVQLRRDPLRGAEQLDPVPQHLGRRRAVRRAGREAPDRLPQPRRPAEPRAPGAVQPHDAVLEPRRARAAVVLGRDLDAAEHPDQVRGRREVGRPHHLPGPQARERAHDERRERRAVDQGGGPGRRGRDRPRRLRRRVQRQLLWYARGDQEAAHELRAEEHARRVRQGVQHHEGAAPPEHRALHGLVLQAADAAARDRAARKRELLRHLPQAPAAGPGAAECWMKKQDQRPTFNEIVPRLEAMGKDFVPR
ncbi:hypothetical protein PybrP1_008720 [[Pythium] brassicae (nom. inval.)]|nr:hypothetical protein PybrP1_008720 [[Pythium] brassicae (nom. inval.)]